MWDSAVVLSKYAEKTRRDFARATTCVELGAGCGLISAVMREIVEVPRVIATDVEGNMELLRENVEKYGVETRALTWGADAEKAFGKTTLGPPGETRAPSERWYGYVKCIGALHGEPVLTFSCNAETMLAFRTGANAPNAPSAAYYEVIRKGLAQSGSADADASAYLDARSRGNVMR